MEKKDFFANIALGNISKAKGQLEESLPVKITAGFLEETASECPRFESISYEERLKGFKAALGELRSRYEPFLSDHAPEYAAGNKRCEIDKFQFRYESSTDRANILNVFDGKGEWETAAIPDYRGPVGKWTGYYRAAFGYGKPEEGKRIFLKFLGVDYIARVYLNSRFVGSHEGFFAPFEFDVTDFLSYEENILVVEVKNDIPTIGLDNEKINGDKIYAATGPGWDDPKEGWHHCPPGAGIYNRVTLEERPEIFIESVFVRPNIDHECAEARIQVCSTKSGNHPVKLRLAVYPRNFLPGCAEPSFSEITDPGEIEPAGNGLNYYRFTLPMEGCRLWTCDEPWLYTLRVFLENENNTTYDCSDSIFGMRKFHMDEASEPKGTLYLNNREVFLRGANDMGHMQQCVMKGDFRQLIDDILIAKLANMNYYRFTQRPVQEEIYFYCDMLGMMNQTDLPLFGYLRKNQTCEAVRQAAEMERLIRSHPSAVMVSYINEPFSAAGHGMGHRHLLRDELEAFFEACNKMVKVENPDRVIKHVEGDYDPPTGEGLSDFHCYNLWYTNHALPIGKLYKGFLPPLKKGWKTGCGEYGTEGLDNLDVMQARYPEEWLPAVADEAWNPGGIVLSQTNSMHGDWFEEQESIEDWISESQKHQAFATGLMTDALRRRVDKVVSSAVHLLIDAWPSGWMKTLVGMDRIPKPAFFAYEASLEPIRVNLRCDRWKAYAGETLDVEVWALNDTPEEIRQCRIKAALRDAEEDHCRFEAVYDVKASAAECAGVLRLALPEVRERKRLYVDAFLLDGKGQKLNGERFEIEVFPSNRPVLDGRFYSIGRRADSVLDKLGITCDAFSMDNIRSADVSPEKLRLCISDREGYNEVEEHISELVSKGATVLFIEAEGAGGARGNWAFAGKSMAYRNFFERKDIEGVSEENDQGIFFVARDRRDPATREFAPGDFSFWYNSESDRIDYTAVRYIEGDGLAPLLFSYRKPAFSDRVKGKKAKLPVAACMEYGRGRAYFVSLCTDGRVGLNPVLDSFLRKLLE